MFIKTNIGGPSARAAVLALGAGFGAGTAYQQNQALVRASSNPLYKIENHLIMLFFFLR